MKQRARILSRTLFYGLIIWAVGFFFYYNQVQRLIDQPLPAKAGGIVVLTGGAGRLEPAVALLQNQQAERLLISGVHNSVLPAEIKRLTGASEQLLTCCIDLDYIADDTISNVRETVNWAHKHGYRHIILVTADYHMPRSLVLLDHAATDIKVSAYAVQTEAAFPYFLTEYHKYLATLIRQSLL